MSASEKAKRAAAEILAFATGLAFVFGAGCASTKYCDTADWKSVGSADAVRLEPEDFVSTEHVDTCGERVDRAAYRVGYERGMAKACTPEDAFVFAIRDRKENPYCTPAERQAARSATEAGREYAANARLIHVREGLRDQALADEREARDQRAKESATKSLIRGIFASDSRASDRHTLELTALREKQIAIRRDWDRAFARDREIRGMEDPY